MVSGINILFKNVLNLYFKTNKYVEERLKTGEKNIEKFKNCQYLSQCK